MDVFALFAARVADALKALYPEVAAELLARVVVEPPRDAAPWRPVDQCRDGRRQAAGQEPARGRGGAGRAFQGRSRMSTSVEVAGPGFLNFRLADPVWHRGAALGRCAGRRLTAAPTSAAASRSTSSTSRPTRPARCMSAIPAARCSATRWPRSGLFRLRRDARILHQRRRQPDRHARPARRSCATARRWARPSRSRAGFYPGDYLIPVGQALADEFGGSARWQARSRSGCRSSRSGCWRR